MLSEIDEFELSLLTNERVLRVAMMGQSPRQVRQATCSGAVPMMGQSPREVGALGRARRCAAVWDRVSGLGSWSWRRGTPDMRVCELAMRWPRAGRMLTRC